MNKTLGFPLKLISRLSSLVARPIKSGFTKIMEQNPDLTAGQAAGSVVGVLAVLLLAWWTVGIGSYRGGHSPWQFVVALGIGIVLGLAVILVSRDKYLPLFIHHFGWIPVTLGVLSYWYWLWYANGNSVNVGFFETAAQVLPVILLAAIVDVRQSTMLKSDQLALPIIAVFLGEVAALNEAAFNTSPITQGRVAADFAVVTSSLVTAVAALIMAVLADAKQESPGRT